MKNISVSASLLASDLSDIKDAALECERAGVDMIHFDVMDGVFVEQITFGAHVLKGLKRSTHLPVDVHLMVDNPTKQIEFFAEAGADSVTLHAESRCDVSKCLERIHELGMKAAVAIKPATPASVAFNFIPQCDMLLVMTVEPGYGGQSFMADMMPKVQEIRKYADRNGFFGLDIQVDGGIGADTADIAKAAGANILVAGTSLFRAEDMRGLCALLKR